MARTDADAIAEILEVDVSISLTPFIAAANALVTELCTSSGYSDERLAMIECWLSAHFYCVRDPRQTSEGLAGLSSSNQLYTGPNLQSTEYGQTAMALDTAGNLNRLNQKMVDGKGKQPCKISTLMTDEDRRYYGVE